MGGVKPCSLPSAHTTFSSDCEERISTLSTQSCSGEINFYRCDFGGEIFEDLFRLNLFLFVTVLLLYWFVCSSKASRKLEEEEEEEQEEEEEDYYCKASVRRPSAFRLTRSDLCHSYGHVVISLMYSNTAH